MQPGDVVGDRFVLEQCVGSGGMGEVFSATDRESGLTVAFKAIKGVMSPEQWSRFRLEARILSELSHPTIVRHVADGVGPDGSPWLAMEWLNGEDLQQRITREPLTNGDVVAMARRIAEALAAAHAKGVVHRDIKPSNIFLVEGDPKRAKLVDFGVARARGVSRGLTRTGAVIGTLGYMAPEQARGSREVDGRTDLFALGCVLYECLGGAPAFSGDHAVAVLAQILFDEPLPLETRASGLPGDLVALVRELMEKAPDARPPDAESTLTRIDALQPFDGNGLPSAATQMALTRSEQRFQSIVLVAPFGRRDAEAFAATLLAREVSALSDSLLVKGAEFSGEASAFADGSVLVVFRDAGALEDAATTHAERAARYALSVRGDAPEALIALVSGFAEIQDRRPVGALVDRAASLLSSPSSLGARAVLIDDQSVGLIEGSFHCEVNEGRCYLVEPAAEGTRLLLGRRTPFVGRGPELAFLERIWDECRDEGCAFAALVVAPAGAGKSRLLHELVSSALTEGMVRLEARADPVHAGAPFTLVEELLRRGIFGSERPTYEALRAHLTAHLDPDVLAPSLGVLSELMRCPPDARVSAAPRGARDDHGLFRERLQATLVRWLEALSKSRPVLLTIEDVHWADLASVELIEAGILACAEHSLMVVATARPTVDDVFPDVWASTDVQRMELPPLRRRAAKQLATSVLGDALPAERVARILDQAEGNAFYLEELIRHAATRGDDAPPESVLAMAQSRLVGLDTDTRRVLRGASIFGERFWVRGVQRVLGDEPRGAELADSLARLRVAELIRPVSDSRFVAEQEMSFRHGLLRDAAYAGLTPDDQIAGHRLAGEWLDEHEEPDAKVVAQHFVLGEQPGLAAPHFLRAAQRAFSGGTLRELRELSEKGIECGAEGRQRGQLRLLQCQGTVYSGRAHREMPPLAAEALELLPEDGEQWFDALSQLGWCVVYAGEVTRRERFIELAGRAAHDPRPLVGGLHSAFQIVNVLLHLGEPELVRGVIARIDRGLEGAAPVDPVLDGYRRLARAMPYAFGVGPRELAVPDALAAVGIFAAHGHGFGLAVATFFAGMTLLFEHRFEEAEQHFLEATRSGFEGIRTDADVLLAHVELALKRTDVGRARLERALTSADVAFGAIARVALARLSASEGELERAHELLRPVLEEQPHLVVIRIEALLVRAALELAGDDVEAAQATLDEAETLFRAVGGPAPIEPNLRKLRRAAISR